MWRPPAQLFIEAHAADCMSYERRSTTQWPKVWTRTVVLGLCDKRY